MAMAFAIIAGTVTDPLIGAISDNSRSRFGRGHPFLLIPPLTLVLCVFLIFRPPYVVAVSVSLLYKWLCWITIFQRTFQLFYVVLLLAMGAELSTDYLEGTLAKFLNSLFVLNGGIFMLSVA